MYTHIQIYICNRLVNKSNELTGNREDLIIYVDSGKGLFKLRPKGYKTFHVKSKRKSL